MAIQTLYRAGDGSIHESKAEAIKADAIVDLSLALDKLIQENNPNAKIAIVNAFRLNIMEYISSQKEGAEVVALMDKFCTKHNKHYKKQMTPDNDFGELGWEALDGLRKMAKFCLENNYVIDSKYESQQCYKELVSFSGANIDG